MVRFIAALTRGRAHLKVLFCLKASAAVDKSTPSFQGVQQAGAILTVVAKLHGPPLPLRSR
jgi:hypothetical protein